MKNFKFDPNIVTHQDYKNVEVLETRHFDTCHECKGSGEMPLPWSPDMNYRCKTCKGTGTIDSEKERMKSIRERVKARCSDATDEELKNEARFGL